MIGLRIKYLRLKRGFTKTELAEKIGIHQTSVTNYENGYSIPSVYVIGDIARCFGVSTDYLIFGDGNDDLLVSRATEYK